MTLRRLLWAIGLASWLLAPAGRVAHAQTSPRAAMLEASAWDAIEANKYDAAAAAFREALAGDPHNPRLHLGAALAAFATRRDADAKASLERVLERFDTLGAFGRPASYAYAGQARDDSSRPDVADRVDARAPERACRRWRRLGAPIPGFPFAPEQTFLVVIGRMP